MKTSVFRLIVRNGYLLLFSLFFFTAFVQTAKAQIVLAGTNFEPVSGSSSKPYFGADEISWYGAIQGKLTLTPPLATSIASNGFITKTQYAITTNPASLNSRYIDNTTLPAYSLVGSPTTKNEVNFLEYTLTGLVPNSAVSVLVNYSNVNKPNIFPCESVPNAFRSGINLDQFNQYFGIESKQLRAGVSGSQTFTGTANSAGEAVIRINYHYPGECSTIALHKLEIKGSLLPAIFSEAGNEICTGEQVLLKPAQQYNGTYQWQVNEGTAWANLGTNSVQLYEFAKTQTTKFRLVVSPAGSPAPVTSSELSINSIQCCQGPNGAFASKQTIFHENFGRLDLRDSTGKTYYVWDYQTDPRNPKEVIKTTTTPFRWTLPVPPPATVFKGVGNLYEGEYVVSGYLTGFQPVKGIEGPRLAYVNNITGFTTFPDLGLDHSGKPDGGVLILSNAPNTKGNVIYEKEFTNICVNNGNLVYFECYLAIAGQGPNPVDVNVKLTSGTTTVLLNGVACKQGGICSNAGKWTKISGGILLTGTSLKMEIINNFPIPGMQENIIALDDIRLQTCAPPSANLFFTDPSFSQQTTLCVNPVILNVVPSANLEKFYGNATHFLYQWTRTPTDIASWKNLGSATTAELSTLLKTSTVFTGLVTGDKVYFRTLAGAVTGLSTVQNANILDPCRNYSVSNTIEVTVDKSATCTTSVGLEKDHAASTALMYPNPSSSSFTLSNAAVSYNAYTSLGDPIVSGPAGTVFVNHWTPGLYTIAITLKDGSTVWQKFVKE